MKHGGGGVIIQVCFAATGPRKLAVIDTMMNSTLYKNILETRWPHIRLKNILILVLESVHQHISPPISTSVLKYGLLPATSLLVPLTQD